MSPAPVLGLFGKDRGASSLDEDACGFHGSGAPADCLQIGSKKEVSLDYALPALVQRDGFQ